MHNTPKIVSSSDEKVYETIKKIYQCILSAEVIKASSIKVAEAAKMYENVQRDVLIALANEFSEYCRAEGIDMREVTACASSKWNFSAVNPGLVGGHCISVDPYYLIDRAAQKGLDLSLVKTARNVNELKPEAVASRISDIIVKQRTKVEHPLVLLLGITYKANIPDCRNTKIPNIIQFLERRGIKTIVYDPIADSDYVDKEYNVRLITVQELKVMNFNLV